MTTPIDPLDPHADGKHRRGAVAEASFASDARSVGHARELVAKHLREQGWSIEAIDAARLVTSELATNAVLHAATDFEVRCLANDDVRIEIADREPSGEVEVAPTEPVSSGGKGLQIVAASSSRWGVDRDTTGKTVWCELDDLRHLDD